MIAEINPDAKPGDSVRDVLQGGSDADLRHAIVLGHTKNNEFFAQTSTGDFGTLLVLIETFRHLLTKDMLE